MSVCLVFYDSSTCNSTYQDVVLPQTAASTPVVFPSDSLFPNGGFWAGWGVAAKRNDFGVFTATVSVTGNSVTSTAGSFKYELEGWGEILHPRIVA